MIGEKLIYVLFSRTIYKFQMMENPGITYRQRIPLQAIFDICIRPIL